MLGMTSEDLLFHSFAGLATISALLVVFISNPIYSALFLALAMSILGAIFFTLEAYFIAVAQITVYAGAVMVLFVMVVMLFDLKTEHDEIFKLSPLNLAKLISTGILCGFLVGTGWLAVSAVSSNPGTTLAPHTVAKDLSKSNTEKPTAVPNLTPTESSETAGVTGKEKNPDDDLTTAEAASLVESKQDVSSTVLLSQRLFSKFVFAFEAVSLLLLVAIVGAVALARSKGGTHHASR